MKRLLQTAITTLSLAGAFAVGAAEVISLNFGVTEDKEKVAENVTTGYIPVPSSAWKDLWNATGNATGVTVYNTDAETETANDGVAVTWQSASCWQEGGYDNHSEMYAYLDEKDANDGNRVRVTLENLPFDVCDIIIYCNCNNGNKVFAPFAINGVYYTWDADKGEARLARRKSAFCQPSA